VYLFYSISGAGCSEWIEKNNCSQQIIDKDQGGAFLQA
jgi:hypothetical protein